MFDFITDAWDWLTEKLSEGFESFWEIFSGMWTLGDDFSYAGAVFAILAVGVIYFTHPYMLGAMTERMKPFSRMFWIGATYVATGIVGYLAGRRMFED